MATTFAPPSEQPQREQQPFIFDLKGPALEAQPARERQPFIFNFPGRQSAGFNNPGNLKDDQGNFREFSTPEEGWRALHEDLRAKMSGRSRHGLTPESTILDLAKVYAPAADNNIPENWASNVARKLGTTTSARIGDYLPRVEEFGDAVAVAEGTKIPKAARQPFMFDFKGAPTAETPPPPARPDAGFLQTSLIKPLAGTDIGGAYDKLTATLNQHLPQGMRGNFALRTAEELVRIFPEGADFFTSPMGIGLIGLHLVPWTAPVAPFVDLGLGALAGAQSIGSIVEAFRNPQPETVAQALKDIAVSAMALKGGGKLYRKIAGKPEPVKAPQVIKDLQALAGQPEEQAALWQEIATPKSTTERWRQNLYRTPVIRDFSSMVGVPKPKMLQVGQYLVERRQAFLNQEQWLAERLAYQMRRTIPDAERDVQRLGYAIQGSTTADEAGLGPSARRAMEDIRTLDERTQQFLKETYGEKIPLQEAEHYLAQMWNPPKNRGLSEAGVSNLTPGSRTRMRDPFLRKKIVPDYKFGIEELGLTPKYRDVADLVVIRHRIAATTAANQMMAKTLKGMGAILTEAEAQKAGVARLWPQLEAPALDRAAYAGKGQHGEVILRPRPVQVHPDIAMSVEAIFAPGLKFRDPITGQRKIWGYLEDIRSFTKQRQIGWSIFHHWALSEQGHALYLLRKPAEVGKATFIFNPDFYKGLKSGVWELRGKPSPYVPPAMEMSKDVALPWLDAGLNFRTTDAEASLVKRLREYNPEGGFFKQKVVKPIAKTLGSVDYVMNRSLWDFYQQGQMVHAAELIYGQEMRAAMKRAQRSLTPEEAFDIRRSVAKHINQAYGAESMEQMLIHPRMRQAMNFLLFAPHWTLSNIRILADGYQTEMGRKLALRWAAGAAMSWFITTQAANYAVTSALGMPDKNGNKGGHFTWDNAGSPMRAMGRWIPDLTENAVNIAAGFNRDGSQRYIRFGKAYREPFMWLIEPYSTFVGKMAPFPTKEVFVQVTGVEPGSQFQVIKPPGEASETERAYQRLSSLGEIVTPFFLEDVKRWAERKAFPELVPQQGTSQIMGLPVRKGLTSYRAAEAYMQALQDKRPDIARLILVAARQNNVAPAAVISQVRQRLASRARTARGPRVQFTLTGEPEEAPPEQRIAPF